jgi:predicted ferric reductase
MPVLAGLLYWLRILRRPMDARLKRRHVGASILVTLGAVVVVIWERARPPGLANSYFWGEVAGVLVVYLLTWSLLLATRAQWIEPWFGGLDRMYLWHKRCAIAAIPLLAPHVLVTGTAPHKTPSRVGLALGVLSMFGLLALVTVSLPRASRILHLGYERWLFLHRLTGLFLIVGVLHGLSVDLVIGSSRLLWAIFAAVGTVGVAAYAYDELLMRGRVPAAQYTVVSVDYPATDIVEMRLAPTGPSIRPAAGQFIYVHVGGDGGWREHPFSVAGTDADGQLRLSIRTRGADTRRMHAELVPGLPATVTGPYGMFDFTLGGARQVWIAGGIGVVPFLSWLQALTPEDRYSIDLFYTVPTEADALYLPELLAASERLPTVRIHPVFSRTEGHLDGAAISDAIGPIPAHLHAFLCGPVGMVEALSRDLRRNGVPRDYIHAEHFSFR